MSIFQKNSVKNLVSVIIPTYNRAATLVESVRSVFSQTYRGIECIIVDDGSEDDTGTIVQELMNEAPKGIEIRYFKKDNGGANSARNCGLMHCKGEFICFLDSDDLLTENSVFERVNVLTNNQDVDFCYGLSSIKNEKGIEVSQMNSPWPGVDEARISKYLFHTNSPLIRRSVLAKTGLWREDDPGAQELEYFAKLKYHAKKVVFIDKKLSVYVKHANERIVNSTNFWYGIYKNLLAVKIIVLYNAYDNIHERRELSMGFRNVAKQLYRIKDYQNACRALEESMILSISLKVITQWFVIKCIQIMKPIK